MNIMSLQNAIVVSFNFLQVVTTRLNSELGKLDKQQCHFLEGSELTVLIPGVVEFAYLVQSLNRARDAHARTHTHTHLVTS
jgi:hypothetical protein